MNWDAIGAIAETLGAIGVLATLAYLSMQIRQNKDLIATSIADSEFFAGIEVNKIMASDPEAARVWNTGFENRDALESTERTQFQALVFLSLRECERGYVRLTQDRADASLAYLLNGQGFRDVWADLGATFPPEFQANISRLMARAEPITRPDAAKDAKDSAASGFAAQQSAAADLDQT